MNPYSLSLPGRAVGWLKRRLFQIVMLLPGGRTLREIQASQVPVDFDRWFAQRIAGINAAAYWPMHPSSTVTYVKRISIGIETSPGWSAGCYIQGVNGIYIGDYTQIAPNVGIISGNHDPYCLPDHLPAKPIRIGRYCLLGMGSVILPGVELGDYTIVAANAVVTKSYPEGFAVLAGSPAKVVNRLDPAKRRDYRSKREYHGYVPASEFEEFTRRHLQLV